MSATPDPKWFPDGADVPLGSVWGRPHLLDCLRAGTVGGIRIEEDGSETALQPGWWKDEKNIIMFQYPGLLQFFSHFRVAPGRPLNPKAPAKHAGGASTKHDWEGALIELARLQFEEGLEGRKQVELIKHLQNWFSATYDAEPSRSQIQERVVRFQAAMDD
jgi:hypothetical protein